MAEKKEEEKKERKTNALRFSLAGVQLKFSAIKSAFVGLTIPAEGVGGSWIIKLPSMKFDEVPENEFSMMTIAEKIGMDVPEVQLVDPTSISRLPDGIEALKGKAFAVKDLTGQTEGQSISKISRRCSGSGPTRKMAKPATAISPK